MSDRVKQAEADLVQAAIRLVETRIHRWSEQAVTDAIKDIESKTFWLLKVSHQRDVVRRKLPRKRAKR